LGISFEVQKFVEEEEEILRFWILEFKEEEGATKRKAWVFMEQPDATQKIKELLSEEEDLEKVSPDKYNLQEIEIKEEKYNIKPISWFKVMVQFAKGA